MSNDFTFINHEKREGSGDYSHTQPGLFPCVVCEFYRGEDRLNEYSGKIEPSAAFILQVQQSDGEEPKKFYFFIKESLGSREMRSATGKFFNAILGGGTDLEDEFGTDIPGPDYWVKDPVTGDHRHLQILFEEYTKKNGSTGLKAVNFLPQSGATWGPINYLTRAELEAMKQEAARKDKVPF